MGAATRAGGFVLAAWLGLARDAVAWGATGTLIVIKEAEATASLFDLGSGEEVAKVPTGAGPHEVAVSPDGRPALVADYGEQTPGSTLTLIDVATARAVRTIDLSPRRRPHGIVWLGEEARVAVTSETSRALLLVDVGSGTVERAIPTRAPLKRFKSPLAPAGGTRAPLERGSRAARPRSASCSIPTAATPTWRTPTPTRSA